MGIYGQDIDKLAEIHYDRMFDEYFAEGEPKYQCECCKEWFDEEVDICYDCKNYLKLLRTVVALGTDEQQEYALDCGFFEKHKVESLFQAYIDYSGATTIEDDIANFLFTHKHYRDDVNWKLERLDKRNEV